MARDQFQRMNANSMLLSHSYNDGDWQYTIITNKINRKYKFNKNYKNLCIINEAKLKVLGIAKPTEFNANIFQIVFVLDVAFLEQVKIILNVVVINIELVDMIVTVITFCTLNFFRYECLSIEKPNALAEVK